MKEELQSGSNFCFCVFFPLSPINFSVNIELPGDLLSLYNPVTSELRVSLWIISETSST